MRCPKCKSPAVQHCNELGCVWVRCIRCRSFGKPADLAEQWFDYLPPATLEVMFDWPAIADEARNPARPNLPGVAGG